MIFIMFVNTFFSEIGNEHGKSRVSTKRKIYLQLRDQIVRGNLVPGERVKETLLAQKFNCSPGPVREALNQLEREGFLDLVLDQGAVIGRMYPNEVEDFYTLLEILEGKAVKCIL